jgi:hypothetical protein
MLQLPTEGNKGNEGTGAAEGGVEPAGNRHGTVTGFGKTESAFASGCWPSFSSLPSVELHG